MNPSVVVAISTQQSISLHIKLPTETWRVENSCRSNCTRTAELLCAMFHVYTSNCVRMQPRLPRFSQKSDKGMTAIFWKDHTQRRARSIRPHGLVPSTPRGRFFSLFVDFLAPRCGLLCRTPTGANCSTSPR